MSTHEFPRLHRLSLVLEEAPTDAFTPDGPKKYRVMLTAPRATGAAPVQITDAWDHPQGALDQAARQIRHGFTRWEAALLSADVQTVQSAIANLVRRVRLIGEVAAVVKGRKLTEWNSPSPYSHGSGASYRETNEVRAHSDRPDCPHEVEGS